MVLIAYQILQNKGTVNLKTAKTNKNNKVNHWEIKEIEKEKNKSISKLCDNINGSTMFKQIIRKHGERIEDRKNNGKNIMAKIYTNVVKTIYSQIK